MPIPEPTCSGRLLSLTLLGLSSLAMAEPSGGPYGPVDRTYEIPDAGHVYYVAPDGKADASGDSPERPTYDRSGDRAVSSPATPSSCAAACTEPAACNSARASPSSPTAASGRY